MKYHPTCTPKNGPMVCPPLDLDCQGSVRILAESVSDLCDLELFAPHATLFTMKWGLEWALQWEIQPIMGYNGICIYIYI